MPRRNILAPGVAEQYKAALGALKDPAQFPWPGNPWGSNNLAIYDFFVYWHHRAMMLATPPGHPSRNAAHRGPAFLPWHRYMLLMFEFHLRVAANDSFRLPYWDWAGDAALPSPAQSPVWLDENMGSFADGTWRVRIDEDPTQGGRPTLVDQPLVRQVGIRSRLTSRAEIRALVRDTAIYDSLFYNTTSAGLRTAVEGSVGPGHHNAAHGWIGGLAGDMLKSTSPNDPMFFLLHANVDRIWTAWQAKPGAAYAPGATAPGQYQFHRLDDPMHTFFNHGFDITPRLMLDVSAYYEYDSLADLV